MKKIDLGQTITILANVGVIAGIIFLGIEIRDNATQARAAINVSTLQAFSDWQNRIAGNPQLLDVYDSGLTDWQSLSGKEQIQFDFLMRSFLQLSLGAITAQRSDLLPMDADAEDRVVEGGLLRMMEQPGFRQWWSTADLRGIPTPIFDVVDRLLESTDVE